jgi:hypothetical protein
MHAARSACREGRGFVPKGGGTREVSVRASARPGQLLVVDPPWGATVAGVESETSTAPLQFLILLVAGFLQRRQKEAIAYLVLSENSNRPIHAAARR